MKAERTQKENRQWKTFSMIYIFVQMSAFCNLPTGVHFHELPVEMHLRDFAVVVHFRDRPIEVHFHELPVEVQLRDFAVAVQFRELLLVYFFQIFQRTLSRSSY